LGVGAHDPEHHEQARARARGLAVLGHVNHGLQVHVIEQPSVLLTDGTQVVHVLANAILAVVDAAAEDLDDAVGGEEVRDIVLHRLIDVVAVNAREIFDCVEILEPLDLAFGLRHGLLERRDRCG
jgi:hypothetical protein